MIEMVEEQACTSWKPTNLICYQQQGDFYLGVMWKEMAQRPERLHQVLDSQRSDGDAVS